MLWLAITALILAFMIQNLAELRGGGPPAPAFIRPENRDDADRIRRRAIPPVSLLVPVLLITGARAGWPWLVLMIAGAMAANALVQLGHSIRSGQMQPRTVSGLALMLPAAIWLSVATGRMPEGAIWMLPGAAVTMPLLVLIWLSAGLAGGR